ncbi:MAG: DsrE/DsrF/DrsH-like family protein, partial [Bacteroidales bacterium]
ENEVIGIDRKEKQVTVKRADGSTYSESYDKLLLSPGASAIRPALEGIDSENIFTLRNVTDTDTIKNYITENSVKKAVVIGAGFIGLEMAENLNHLGIETSIVEMTPQVMAPLDYSMASFVHQYLTEKGIHLYLGEAVTGFVNQSTHTDVHLKSGLTITTELVILAIGVRPNNELARMAGLEIGETTGIKVNDHLQTSDKDIYAVGDVIEYPHPLTNTPWLNLLAGPANRQARIVADNMVYGNTKTYEGSIGTGIAKVFDMTVASTGLPAKKLAQWGIPYKSSTTHSGSHAGYYPGSVPMSIKLTFDPNTGKIFGAQIVGYEGVDKRMDEIALVIKKGGTVYDLQEIEHAYAPPFSSAKDPAAMAGYVAGNILEGKFNPVYWRELIAFDPKSQILIDVRTVDEYELGNIPGSVNIPLDEMRKRFLEIPKNKEVIVYCAIGLRGYLAARILMQQGFTHVRNLSGGYKTYKAALAPIVNQKISSKSENQNKTTDMPTNNDIKTLKVDACGLQCPGPVMKMKKSLDDLEHGERIEMTATDAGFPADAEAWCRTTGNKLVSKENKGGKFSVIIEKSEKKTASCEADKQEKGKTFILFSDDLDKALATFVLANGAAATGKKTTIFFTFWGLNAIKKNDKPAVQKDIFGKMFGMMLPSSSLKLKLSKMNMGGAGSKMMRYLMKSKGIDSLESLRDQAIENGVEFIACQMSMDVMGVKREELLDNVTIGGVATYMERADQANVNLF